MKLQTPTHEYYFSASGEHTIQRHRIEELLELLQAEWLQDPDLTLLQFLPKVASEAGFLMTLETISDDTLIYQLKMRSRGETE